MNLNFVNPLVFLPNFYIELAGRLSCKKSLYLVAAYLKRGFMFLPQDEVQFRSKGIAREQVEEQIEYFRKGFPFLALDRPATAGDGILVLHPEELCALAGQFDAAVQGKRLLKFVPASGAASRMFKDLFEFLQDGEVPSAAVRTVLSRLEDFAFYKDLMQVATNGVGAEVKPNAKEVIRAIVSDQGLGYGSLPKALLKFHRYGEQGRTAFEEHCVEGVLYARNDDDTVDLHFTVSPEHLSRFEELVPLVTKRLSEQYGVAFRIGFSQQKPSTDTVAVGSDNAPFRSGDGSILFRPGGHGALLDNLGDLDADVVFVKTVDNVLPDRLKGDVVLYKKALTTLLLQLEEKCFGWMHTLASGPATEDTLRQAAAFLADHFAFPDTPSFRQLPGDQRQVILMEHLDRPLRVCGMVRNEGEPGGGPFWVRQQDGSVSLQIAESSQIDFSDPAQKAIAEGATHFNPVDLVCSLKNFQGERFDLRAFRDPLTGFISSKSKDGKPLKALELPGLWNGAMAFWNTVFVEVPISTFVPVKTVLDLLRPQHQN